MVARGLKRTVAGVDWAAPWFKAVGRYANTLAGESDVRSALSSAAQRLGICNAAGQPIRFVAPDAAGAVAYEVHIGATGEVPTRDDLHDYLNALSWLAFPRSKARLNALQAAAIATNGVRAQRGPLRDGATLIDENGMLLVTRRADLVDALHRHDWSRLFIEQRDAWHRAVHPLVFGHALLVKLTAPYKGITAHVLPVPLAADAPLDEVDACVAAMLDASLTPRGLMPLPVLGIPGWAANREPAYYDDPSVFRAAKCEAPKCETQTSQ